MKVVICIKQVADKDARLKINGAATWIEESELAWAINEADLFALEEGLRLKEKHGGEVVLLSMGPARTQEALRKALAMGADRALHLDDPAFEGSDVATAARIIAKAIARDGFDLALFGVQSDDLGSAQLAPRVAEHLGVPHAAIAMGIAVDAGSGTVTVKRELDAGTLEVVALNLPAVVSVQLGMNEVRYASLKGIMAAKKKPIAAIKAADLGLSAAQVGAAASRTQILKVGFPSAGEKGKAEIFGGPPAQAVAALIEKLRKEAKVL
ncbi:MAG: electron transfer flavoprotein subunit beta/FixA family protein [Candidatus Schekmanbacteria bacterium]|nr:electron transfer flavoprotein subunit beta/FixA family protein [Candidatus Schekmanbacteria bacterium]